MISPFHGRPPPYELASDIVYFHDWRYVQHGGYRWADAEGKTYPLWGSESVPPLRYEYVNMPLGIELAAQPARKTEPVLTSPSAQEPFLGDATVIYEDGLYRLWYDAVPSEAVGTPGVGLHNILRYAESENGADWKLPSLGLLERNGNKKNNVVYGPARAGPAGYHGGCVFKDPSGPPGERYKLFYLGTPTDPMRERYLKARPTDVDPVGHHGLCGAVSPDGLRWTVLPDPLVLVNSDTKNVCEYDVTLGKYVAYVRSWFFCRRTIGRMETDDFRRFPVHEEVFWPSGSMHPYELWYTSGKTRMPGTTDYHVMFPMRWTLTEDKFDFHLAASPDNVVWNLVPGGPVCQPGDPGDWDGGVVAPGVGMVDLPANRIGMLMCATPVPHKHPRRPPFGALAWAYWPKGRLVALRSPVEGSFALWPLKFKGRSVHLNFKTPLTGFVKVEAAGADGKVIPNRRFDDCDRLVGDHLDHLVTWKGQSDLGHPETVPVTLRFRLRSTELYSVEFRKD